MKQETSIRQTTRLAPQQIMVAKMVQSTNEELENLIVAETEKNLALELMAPSSTDDGVDCSVEGDDFKDDYSDSEEETAEKPETDDYSESSFMSFDDDEPVINTMAADNSDYSPCANYRSDRSFREELLSQLDEMQLSEEDLYLSQYLVDSLDDRGYLPRSIVELVDDLAFTQGYETTADKLEQVLMDVVQSLDPIGIGARNLQECLKLQLQEKKSTPVVQLAYRIVDESFENLSAHRVERLCAQFEVTTQQLAEAQNVIAHLNPSPGGQSSSVGQMEVRASHIKPDFSIHNEDGELDIRMNDSRIPSVRISPDYMLMQERIQQTGRKSEDNKQGLQMIRESIISGRQFIEAIQQRKETLSRVIRVIAQLQHNYFLNGGAPEDLRPMGLQEVADRSGYDVSTISRVSNSKFIETDFGIIPIKDLFTTGIQTEDGNTISNVEVQEALRSLIESENKRAPLSDDALAAALNQQGFPVARRTVTKYREQLKFPTARLRREA